MKIIDIKNMKAYRIEDAKNFKQALTILHRTARYHYHDVPVFHIKLDLDELIDFTAAPVTTEAPERGQYANKPEYYTYNDPTAKATDKQVRALIYAISNHDINGKDLNLPKSNVLSKTQVQVLFKQINAAPAKPSNFYRYTVINNWFAKKYTEHHIVLKFYNEFTKEQEAVQHAMQNNPQKLKAEAVKEEETQYSKYNI